MKHGFNVRQLIRSLLSGSVTKKTNATFTNHPDNYWKAEWIPRSIDEAIDYLS
jgi:hypothetical protein